MEDTPRLFEYSLAGIVPRANFFDGFVPVGEVAVELPQTQMTEGGDGCFVGFAICGQDMFEVLALLGADAGGEEVAKGVDGEVDAVVKVGGLGVEPLLEAVVEHGIVHIGRREMQFDLSVLVEVRIYVVVDDFPVGNTGIPQVSQHLFAVLAERYARCGNEPEVNVATVPLVRRWVVRTKGLPLEDNCPLPILVVELHQIIAPLAEVIIEGDDVGDGGGHYFVVP